MNYDNSTLPCIYDKQFSKQILFLTFDVLVVLRIIGLNCAWIQLKLHDGEEKENDAYTNKRKF